jgi:signal transduction histidine kinase
MIPSRRDLVAQLLVSTALAAMPRLAGAAPAASTAAAPPGIDDKLAPYAYEDTRRLIRLVEDAAALIERNGAAAYRDFAIKGSRWFRDTYLFAYTLDSTCVFHAQQPALMGKNLASLTDMNGKPVIRYITDIGRRPERDASGWVFYLWEESTQLIPAWKGSYIRKAAMPDGTIVTIGSGLYDLKVEKVFVENAVDRAAALIKAEGPDTAFRVFQDRASPFVFLDVYIFAMDDKARTLVDPAYPTLAGRDLSGFEDAVGVHVVDEALHKLTTADFAWTQYLWPLPGNGALSRKLMYVRKVEANGRTIIVGSDFFLATPIWMRV